MLGKALMRMGTSWPHASEAQVYIKSTRVASANYLVYLKNMRLSGKLCLGKIYLY